MMTTQYMDLYQSNPELFKNDGALLEIITDSSVIAAWKAERKATLASQGFPEEWGEIGVVYEDPYIKILRDLVKFPSGRLGSYFRILNSADLKGGQATVVLPVLNGKVLLMRQFRHPTRSWHWEVPRGFGEPNTSPEENAKKELQEEVGGEIAQLIDLGRYHSNTGIEGGAVRLFLAHLKSFGEANQDEGIEFFKLMEPSEIEEMIKDSRITDGFTIAVFTRARLRGLI